LKRVTEEEFREWQFDDDFIEFLHERNSARQRPRTVGRYYPSSLYRCVRQIILEWNAGIVPKDDTLRHFFAGDVYQEHIIDEVMKWKYGKDVTKIEKAVSVSFPVDPRKADSELIMLSGRIDELTMLYIDGVVVAIPNEAKTQKGGLKYRKTPNPDHVRQLMVYLAAVGAPYGKLIYMERSTLHTITFHIDFDLSILKEIFTRARYLHKWVDGREEGLIPPAEAMQSSETKWKCRKDYCQVRDTCFKIEGFINDEPDN